MNPPLVLPPLMRDQRKVDAEHLKLLSVFHGVLAGLSLLGIGFLFLHWLLLHAMFDPALLQSPKGGPVQARPPAEFFAIFKWVYLVMGTLALGLGALNLLSAWNISRRRARILSLVVAGLNCVFFPFGTALGVFTFVVLLRDSVVELYQAAAGQSST